MRSRLLQLGLTGILSAALFSSPAFARGNSQGHGKGKGHDKHQDTDDQRGEEPETGAGVERRHGVPPRCPSVRPVGRNRSVRSRKRLSSTTISMSRRIA